MEAVMESEPAPIGVAPPVAAASLERREVQWADLGVGLGGLLMFGLAGAFGGASGSGPSAVIVHVGPLLLTAPALMVGHQTLQLHADLGAMMVALLDALARSGKLAMGLVPMLVFFGATSQLAPAIFATLILLIGVLGMGNGAVGLIRAERAAGASVVALRKMALLVGCWAVLSGLIGLRLALGVLG